MTEVGGLRVVAAEEPAVDSDAAERAARDLLLALGADLEHDGLRDTPRRVARMYAELLTPKPFNMMVLEAEHLCMSLRGVQKPGVRTVTSALHGLVRDDSRTRHEFLALVGSSPNVM